LQLAILFYIINIKRRAIMIGTPESGKKATETRGQENLREAGQKGGQASSGHKAMETRAQKEGKNIQDVASDMGRKGGEQSHGGGRRQEEEE
jgi:general stress protein YciG